MPPRYLPGSGWKLRGGAAHLPRPRMSRKDKDKRKGAAELASSIGFLLGLPVRV